MKAKKIFKKILIIVAVVFVVGLVLPQNNIIPVLNASSSDWNHETFWYEPWGASGVHKGIDIFSAKGTPVIASTYGIVLFKGQWGIGGNVVAILSSKWRIHYYAHLDSIDHDAGRFIQTAEKIGTVGDSGNAKGKSPHLHYTVLSILPYPWRWDKSTQGWKKMFILNPIDILN
jgi:murein DD-endopeptidase MepM/ murein hydrolase activator NlpD